MNILADYHTHTTFSHGKGTVLQNALSAQQRGLKQLAIADHGFGHLLYGVDKKSLPALKAEIADAEEKTGIRILLGVEANFAGIDGTLDITPEEVRQFDVLLVGHHRFVKSTLKDKFKFFIPNMLGVKTKKQIARNTAAICSAMERYPIDILTHLLHGCPIDLMTVAQKAVETSTYIELNASKMLFSKAQIEDMLALGVKFIISSDAHTPEKVGKVENVLALLEDWNIPPAAIANLDAIPTFKPKT